jgi:hypothetical protein
MLCGDALSHVLVALSLHGSALADVMCPLSGAGPPPEVFGTSALAALRTLLGLGSRMARAPAFEAAEGSGATTGTRADCS